MNVYHLSLSREEEETLKQMYHHAPKRRLRQRALMVLLSHRGDCQKEIAYITGVSSPTARHYLHPQTIFMVFVPFMTTPSPADPKGSRKHTSNTWIAL